MFYQIECPASTGIVDLAAVIPAFMEPANCFLLQPRRSKPQQIVQTGQRAGGNGVVICKLPGKSLYPDSMHFSMCTRPGKRLTQKGRLLVVAFHQINSAASCFFQQNGCNYPWKTAATTQIQPFQGTGIQSIELQTIRNMSAPDVRKG